MGFNPSAPNSIGVEWTPTVESVAPLTTTASCVAWKVASTVAETISTIYVPHTWSGPSSGFGKLVVDVYDLADTGAGDTPTTTRYAPNEDKAIYNVYAPTSSSWGSTLTLGNGYTKIDDGAAFNDSDWLAFPGGAYLRMAFATSGFTGRPASVSFDVRVFGYVGQAGKLVVALYNNTTRVSTLATISPPADGADWPTGFRTYRIGPFTTNPLTGVAWTAADITGFDSGSNLLIQLEAAPGSTAVSWLSMIVESGSDKRVATGSIATQTSLPSGVQTNLPVTLASNWSKSTSTDYLLVARRLDDPAGAAQALIPQVVTLGTATCPHGQGISYSSTLDANGLLSAVGAADATRTVPFWLGTSGTAQSVDSQPYWDLAVRACHTSSTLRQGITGASAQAYKPIRVLLGGSPNADLAIRVKKVSDDLAVGGTAVLTAATLAAASTVGTITDATWGQVPLRSMTVDLGSAATLATATAYYAELTSTAGAATPWLVAMLDATASHALSGNQTYGGTAQQATVAGTGVPAGDLVVLVAASPAAPSSITVTKTTSTINGTSVDWADIDWVSGGSLGTAFSRWEVERSEDSGSTWAQIATITTEATVTFADYEGRRNVAAKYRVRAVRSDGVASDWTTQSNTVTPAASSGAWALFTSNADPTVSVGYSPDGSTAEITLPSADEVVFLALHDRDYTAAFIPLEERGIRWQFTLQVHNSSTVPSAGAGVQAFDALRALARASGSVCLHTADGERFFGALQVSALSRDFGSGAYRATVTFTQTAVAASVVAS